jgi:hypothetical protein
LGAATSAYGKGSLRSIQGTMPARTIFLAIEAAMTSSATPFGRRRMREPAGHRLSFGKRQQGGVLSPTLRPVVLFVKSCLDRRQLRPCHRRTMGRRRAPPGGLRPRGVSGYGCSAHCGRHACGLSLRRLSVARVRQRALVGSSSWRSYAVRDSGVCCDSVTAAATTRR